MKILVIGSEGFIGRHLMEQGLAMGHEMVGCDQKQNSDTPIFWCNAARLIADQLLGFDRVIHSAGILGTSETLENPSVAITENVQITLRVLEVCHKARVPFTYITLGNNWLNPYSITKNCAVEFVRMFNVVHGLPTQVAVCYNVFGPYQKWKPVRKIVPEFMTRLIERRPIEYFNGGEQLVDMVYAPDLARAILQSTGVGTEHYGSGQPRRVSDVAADCARALQVENFEIVNLGLRPGETGPAAISPEPMPNQTPYEQAMLETGKWYVDNYRA